MSLVLKRDGYDLTDDLLEGWREEPGGIRLDFGEWSAVTVSFETIRRLNACLAHLEKDGRKR